MSKTSDVFKNSFINLGSFSLVAIISFINVTLIIRFFGVETQGLAAFASLLSTKGLLSIFVFGLPAIASRKVAFYLAKNDLETLRSWLLATYGAVFCISGVLVFAILPVFFSPSFENILFDIFNLNQIPAHFQFLFFSIFLVSLPLQLISVVSQGILIGTQDFFSLRLSEFLSTCLIFLGTLVLIFTQVNSEIILFIVLIGEILRCLFYVVSVNQKYSLFWIFKGNFKNIKTDFRDEMKVNTLSSLLGYLDNNGAAYVVIKLLGVKALGVFDTLTKASRIFKTAFGFFSTSIMPHAIGREAKKGPQAPIAIFGKVVFLSSFVVFPLIFNLIPLNEVILNFVFGSEVAVYSSAFSLTLLAMISMIYAGLLGATFNARLSTVMITTKVMFFENLIGLPLLYVMATQYGIWGVCANRALVVTLGYFFRLQQTAREYQFSVNVFVKNMLNSLLIGTFFGASLFGLRQSGLEMPAPLFVAPLFMFLCWILIFYKSDQAHKELLSRFYSESVVLIRRLTGRKV